MCLRAGISKRELFEDYYIDEIGDVLECYYGTSGGIEEVYLDELLGV